MEQNTNNSAYARQTAIERFGNSLDGPPSAFVVVVCTHALSANAYKALNNSVRALGWQEGPTYLHIDEPHTFSKADFFELVEALDPICLVLADESACTLAAKAYAEYIPTQNCFRLFGRDAAALANINALVESEQGKQQAWNLLKSLPKAQN